jgi:hypothetical protein
MKQGLTFLTQAILLTATLVSIHGQALGQDSVSVRNELKQAPWFVEKFRVSVGGFLPVSNTNIQVDIKGGLPGAEIDFEKDLGFNTTQLTFQADFQWRITRRSRINLSYYNIPRKSTYTLNREIIFNDIVYPVSASVNSYFNTAIYQVTYGYAIVAKPNLELGVLIGTHLVGGEVGISLNNSNGSISADSDFGFTAPVPDLGIWGGYSFNKRLAFTLDLTYLDLTVGDVSGRIIAYNALFLYRATGKLDIALGYSGLNFRVDVFKTNAEGHFKWGYNGPALGVTYSFGKKPWGG